jgi:hypothetical protein
MGGVSTMLWLPRGYHSYTYLRRTVLWFQYIEQYHTQLLLRKCLSRHMLDKGAPQIYVRSVIAWKPASSVL